MRRPVLILALLPLLGACSGGGGDPAPSTTAAPAPTSTTAGRDDLSPLTGLAQPDVARRSRPALVVKIDNAPKARPQAGINQADVVVSEKVEDGVTRLFTVFQSTDAEAVGPVRSARTTDIALATPLRRPLFSYSGTNPVFQKLIDAAALVDIGFDHASGDYRRDRGRPAPYNLFSTTAALFAHAGADGKAPLPWFTYRGAGARGAGTAVGGVHIDYVGIHVTTAVDYRWDRATGTWRRSQDGTPFADAAGVQVAPSNVVVQFVNYVDTGQRDRSNTAVPEAQLIGDGEASVFTAGGVVRGKWHKATPEAVTTWTDANGAPIALTPGRTWIELAPPGSARNE